MDDFFAGCIAFIFFIAVVTTGIVTAIGVSNGQDLKRDELCLAQHKSIVWIAVPGNEGALKECK